MERVQPEVLLAALERHWDSREFRPLQREAIEAVLEGRDAAVIMPTGGGKSLCYQMPVLFLPGTAVVVSPLIALMRDQVERLNARGIRAAALNSATPYAEQLQIQRDTRAGEVRLLYIAPERLLREDTIELIRQTPVCYYAIDEAHCISEWGHEFRPDYRRLAELRQFHPEAPILALTASATRRVRHDILAQLAMRDPAKFIRSFDRKNLRYLAQKTDAAGQWRLLGAALETHAGRSVIVYASTIAMVEDTVAKLNRRGLRAVSYHAQMPPDARRSAQERWMAGSPAVLVGTIAFGMGIDKPDVRAVIHLSLPKSLEQYYQEAGRAGRDGEPSDCLLLWQPRDIGVIVYFLKQMSDPDERRRAWARYEEIRGYAESAQCRHVAICRHFGEPVASRVCGMCDVCGPLPGWYELARTDTGTRSRRHRSKLAGRFAEPPLDAPQAAAPCAAASPASPSYSAPGVLHAGAPLASGPNASPAQMRGEHSAVAGSPASPAPGAPPAGMHRAVAPGSRTPHASQPRTLGDAAVAGSPAAPTPLRGNGARLASPSQAAAFDPAVFDKLRAWRLAIARRDQLPPYVIFHDSVLRSIAAILPADLDELSLIAGVGPRKLEKYGAEVLRLLKAGP